MAGDQRLALVDQRLQHLALGREPEAVVDQLRIAGHELVLQVRRAAVQGDGFDAPVGGDQDGPAGSLVDPARLHADVAVLDQVQAADAIVVAELVQPGEQSRGRQPLAIDRHCIAALEVDGDHARLVRRRLGGDGALIDVLGRLDGRILQHLALRGGVQKVGVHREGRFVALVFGDGDLVLFGEVDQRLAAGEGPLAPGGDHPDVGLQRVIAELEPHLIVALARGAVTDRVGPDAAGDVDLGLGDQRPGDRGAEQVDALVERVGPEHREDVVADEFLAQILDEDVLGLDAHHQGLLPRRLQLLALAEIGGEGHHFAGVLLLQPLEYDRGVETAGIGEDDLLGRRQLVHREILSRVARLKGQGGVAIKGGGAQTA